MYKSTLPTSVSCVFASFFTVERVLMINLQIRCFLTKVLKSGSQEHSIKPRAEYCSGLFVFKEIFDQAEGAPTTT